MLGFRRAPKSGDIDLTISDSAENGTKVSHFRTAQLSLVVLAIKGGHKFFLHKMASRRRNHSDFSMGQKQDTFVQILDTPLSMVVLTVKGVISFYIYINGLA